MPYLVDNGSLCILAVVRNVDELPTMGSAVVLLCKGLMNILESVMLRGYSELTAEFSATT